MGQVWSKANQVQGQEAQAGQTQMQLAWPVEAETEQVIAKNSSEPPSSRSAPAPSPASPINPMNGSLGDRQVITFTEQTPSAQLPPSETEGERSRREAALLDFLRKPTELSIPSDASTRSDTENSPVFAWRSGVVISMLSSGLLISYHQFQARNRMRERKAASHL